MVQFIKNEDLRPLVHFFLKKPHCLNFGTIFQSSDSTYILLSLYGVWFIDPKFVHWQGFKKIWRSRTSLLMNKILISENALTKWYLLGSIEFLATLKCLIIICCFLPAEFWQKYAVSELTRHVRTSGNFGTLSVCYRYSVCTNMTNGGTGTVPPM